MHAGLDTGTSQAKPLEYLGSLCYVFWVVFPVIMIYFFKMVLDEFWKLSSRYYPNAFV